VTVEDFMDLDPREQWERVLVWLREQGPWMLGTILVVFAGFWGWRYWQSRNDTRDMAAGTRYEQVLTELGQGHLAQGRTLADQLIHDYPGTAYADQAELLAARIDVQDNRLPDAATRLSRVMDSSHDAELKLLARLRLARVQLAQDKPDTAIATLAAVDPGAFAGRYAEVRGDALLAKGDRAGALKAYLAARNGGDSVDGQLLQLKIDDLAHS
jgi:predicted negative regulator of RcsB-dependent stress response